ncbi:uncharacterized protein LOC133651529 isoform X2 [Entelurus aequoreus]|uniref:uncharacterized protein LOC133651529 isoform X2 n=1 Tax=Entelurus aequoreus TaxID=161455 RepID=UPI002B1DBFEA|nr:uncharacterized protein LOC133651529 isoform X2 [Entelurus aequoreus]
MLNLKIFLMTLGFTRLVTGGSLIRSVWILPKNWPIGWMWVKMSLWHRTFQRKNLDRRRACLSVLLALCFLPFGSFARKRTRELLWEANDRGTIFHSEPTFDASYNIFCERIIRQRIIVNQEAGSIKEKADWTFPNWCFKRNICELDFVETLSADKLIDRLPHPSGTDTTESTAVSQGESDTEHMARTTAGPQTTENSRTL